jgi:putative hemolysin
MGKKKRKIIFSVILSFIFIGVFLFLFLPKNSVNNNEVNSEVNPIDSNAIDNNYINSLPNPAAFYCSKMGYQYKIIETGEGEQGICVFPDGTECDEWQFYAGTCGQKWSYCKVHGYELVAKDDGKNAYSPTYSICVDKETKGEVAILDELGYTQRISKNKLGIDSTPLF